MITLNGRCVYAYVARAKQVVSRRTVAVELVSTLGMRYLPAGFPFVDFESVPVCHVFGELSPMVDPSSVFFEITGNVYTA